MSDLTRLEAAAAGLSELPDLGEEADYLGRLDKVIRTLNGHKRAILDELPGPVSGTDYRIAESRYAERSYNTAGLLSRFAGAGRSVADLVRDDVVRLSWQWTKLNRAMADADIDLVVTRREIENTGDIDGPLVGEVWKSRFAIEAVTPDE